MSIKSQQVISSKVETLPDDLKSIAEQMLAEKFKEKPAEKQEQFHGYPGTGGRTNSAWYQGPADGYGPNVRSVPQYRWSWVGIASNRIALDSVYGLKRRLEHEVGNSSRYETELVMGRREFDDLIRDIRSQGVISFGRIPKIFGTPVRLEGEMTGDIRLYARF